MDHANKYLGDGVDNNIKWFVSPHTHPLIASYAQS